MKTTKQQLIIEQVDRKLEVYRPLQGVVLPEQGWINTVRTALKMSLRQLGARLGINASSAKAIEKREKEGSITLNSLREAALALDMQFVYGMIPKQGSIEAMIDKRAEEMAKKIVSRTSQTMKLEDQGNTNERLQRAVTTLKEELKRELSGKLWD